MKVTTEVLRLPLRDPFQIAREENPELATTVLVELELDGLHGHGEALPVAYYGETPGTVEQVVPFLAAQLMEVGAPPDEREAALAWLAGAAQRTDAALGHNGAAKCGLDMALHDICAKRLGLTLEQLLGTYMRPLPTDYSLGLDSPPVVAERASRVTHYPALKIKVGGASDLATLRAVREVYDGPLRVDANTGWQPEEALALLPDLDALGVELVEQPFPARAIAELRRLQERSPLPIVADESAVTIDDLELLAGAVAGVNVKLGKCGGIGPALRMIVRARELGLRVMVGCMVETSLAIRAAVAVAGLAEWVDLDGCLLLADDPFTGLELGDDCRWLPPGGPGLGLDRRPGSSA
jgi:L-Ala-D/L-Glu epimerase